MRRIIATGLSILALAGGAAAQEALTPQEVLARAEAAHGDIEALFDEDGFILKVDGAQEASGALLYARLPGRTELTPVRTEARVRARDRFSVARAYTPADSDAFSGRAENTVFIRDGETKISAEYRTPQEGRIDLAISRAELDALSLDALPHGRIRRARTQLEAQGEAAQAQVARTRGEVRLSWISAEGAPQALVFDARSFRLKRSEEQEGRGPQAPAALRSQVVRRYEGRQKVDGVVIPLGEVRTDAGAPLARLSYRIEDAGRTPLTLADLPDTLLPLRYSEITNPFAFFQSPQAQPGAVEEFGPDTVLFTADGSRKSLIVRTAEGLIVSDPAMIPAEAGAIIAFAKARFPGAQFRAVAISHHHVDHMSGAPAFVREGARIVARADILDTLENLYARLDGPPAVFESAESLGGRIGRVEFVKPAARGCPEAERHMIVVDRASDVAHTTDAYPWFAPHCGAFFRESLPELGVATIADVHLATKPTAMIVEEAQANIGYATLSAADRRVFRKAVTDGWFTTTTGIAFRYVARGPEGAPAYDRAQPAAVFYRDKRPEEQDWEDGNFGEAPQDVPANPGFSPGFAQMLALMREGDRVEFLITPWLAVEEDRAANRLRLFEVELARVGPAEGGQ